MQELPGARTGSRPKRDGIVAVRLDKANQDVIPLGGEPSMPCKLGRDPVSSPWRSDDVCKILQNRPASRPRTRNRRSLSQKGFSGNR
jgi:hypothetical protein